MRYLLILLFSLSQLSWGRFITEEEASTRYDSVHNIITVNKDFTAEWVVEQKQTLLNESARENMKLLRLYYSVDFEAIEILDAHIKNTTIEAVDKALIEDKNLASQAIGFTDTRQISIPFKNVQVGSQVSVTFR